MLSSNQSKPHEKIAHKAYKCRIVATSCAFSGLSTNWKLVVKCPRGGDLSATPSMATSWAYPSKGKSGQHKFSVYYIDRKSSQKYANNNHIVTGLARHQPNQNKSSLDQTHRDFLPKVKVSDHKKVIECTNRFQILQTGNEVVSEPLCDTKKISDHYVIENTLHAHSDISPVTDPNLDLRSAKASQSDASITINPRIGQKGKHEISPG